MAFYGNWSCDSLLIGLLFMSRIVQFFNFIYSLLDSIEDRETTFTRETICNLFTALHNQLIYL